MADAKIVWAKMVGYSSWPAKIVQAPEFMTKPKNKNMVCVFFYGTHN